MTLSPTTNPSANGQLHKHCSVLRLGPVCRFFYLFLPRRNLSIPDFPVIYFYLTCLKTKDKGAFTMGAIGFDNQKYLTTQSEQIKKRIHQFGGKLYLEFGGKLFDDYHASRVLPGFAAGQQDADAAAAEGRRWKSSSPSTPATLRRTKSGGIWASPTTRTSSG